MGINEYIKIGKKMKDFRQKEGIQQEEMAQKLGLSKSTYSNYENEHREPPLDVILNFCKMMNISINQLIGSQFNYYTSYDNDFIKCLSTIHSYSKLLGDILDYTTQLNDEGKNKVFQYINDLLCSGNYDDDKFKVFKSDLLQEYLDEQEKNK